MTQNPLIVTLDGPEVSEAGILAEDFEHVLNSVRTAMRFMVMHLGDREPGPGQPPAWVRDQSRLRLAPTRPGSFVAELTHEPPADMELHQDGYGQQAITALRDWDGAEDSTLPHHVTDCLYGAATRLSGRAELWLGSATEPRRTLVRARDDHVSNLPMDHGKHRPTLAEAEEALLQGWLREVNWDKGTAQLHDYAGDYVRLRFGPELDGEMRRLATEYVEVRGKGRFNERDEWTEVRVEELNETRSWREPFDLDAFLNDPNPKVYDPDKVAPIDLTDEEFESFLGSIRRGREA